MSESRGLVAFDEEVTGPGKAVTDWNPEQRPDVVTTRNGPHEYGQPKQSPTRVQKTVPCARMLLQVEREEIVVGGEPVFVGICHGTLPHYAFERRTGRGVQLL